MRRLVLFDIDGTLVTDGGAARAAYGRALGEVYGYRGDLARYDFSGRTDPQITHMVLRDAGYAPEEIEENLPNLWNVYLAALEANLERRGARALAGIPRLLHLLAGREDVVLALLTGNIEPGARLKLARPSLNTYFPFGAFGSDSANREDLPPIAVERASKTVGHVFSGREVVIIGDSIYDVRCGVPHDATTIAIASGKTPAAQLRAENPHHVFESAEDTVGLITAITA